MLLGECLAGALFISTGYRQITHFFLDITEQHPHGEVLLFVVVRAYSKLAEIDPLMVDMSVLLRVCSQLDAKTHITNDEEEIQILLAMTVGKIRGNPAGELMIKILTNKGRSSRIVAAGAIALHAQRSPSVFYLSELERQYKVQPQVKELLSEPPSRRLLSELFLLDLDQDETVRAALNNAKQEIEQNFPGIDFPYPYLWGIHQNIEVTNTHNAPFAGTVVKVTLRNMVDLFDNLDVSNVACLTEPRIVDALFNNCGALLILDQNPDSPQCRRLRDRGVPFGMLNQEYMSKLSDGDHIVVDHERINLLRS
jgi:hypothetical protein